MNRWITSCLLVACLLGVAVVPPARGASMAPLVLGLSSYVDPVNQPFIDSLRADPQYEWALAVEVDERALEADAVSIALPEQTLVIRRSPAITGDRQGVWYGVVEHDAANEVRRSWFRQPGTPMIPVFRQGPDGRIENVLSTPGLGKASGYIHDGKDTYRLIAMRAGGYVLVKKNTLWIPPDMEDARPLFIGNEAALDYRPNDHDVIRTLVGITAKSLAGSWPCCRHGRSGERGLFRQRQLPRKWSCAGIADCGIRPSRLLGNVFQGSPQPVFIRPVWPAFADALRP